MCARAGRGAPGTPPPPPEIGYFGAPFSRGILYRKGGSWGSKMNFSTHITSRAHPGEKEYVAKNQYIGILINTDTIYILIYILVVYLFILNLCFFCLLMFCFLATYSFSGGGICL